MLQYIRRKITAASLTLAMMVGLLAAMTLTAGAVDIGKTAQANTPTYFSVSDLSGVSLSDHEGQGYFSQPSGGARLFWDNALTDEVIYGLAGQNYISEGYNDSVYFFANSDGTYIFYLTMEVTHIYTGTETNVYNKITVVVTGGSAAPTVTTQAVSGIETTTATGNGNITDLGTPNPTQYGVVWGTSADPTIDLSTKTAQGAAAATGAFTSSINGLTAGTTYHVRAYATNTSGTSYGADVSFTTLGPEISIQGNGNTIASGDANPSCEDYTDFGSVAVATGVVERTFTIQNTGTAALSLAGSSPYVAITGTNAAEFSVTSTPASSIAAGGSAAFQVTFDPAGTGTRTATLSIANDDSDENPYTFTIQGTGLNTAPTVTAGAGSTAYTEQTPVVVDSGIAITDADGNSDWSGGKLKVQITANNASNDTLSLPAVNGGAIWLDTTGNKLMSNTTQIGTADAASVSSGNAWTFTFNANATDNLVRDTAAAVIFNNSSDDPGTSSRTITFTATDKNSDSASASKTVSVTAVDDAPTVGTNTGKTLNEGSINSVIAECNLEVTDADTATAPANITYTVTAVPANGTLEKSGSVLAINGTFTQDDINNNRVTYTHDGSETVSDSFSFTVSDGAGGSIAETTFAITITPVNDVPTVTNSTKSATEDTPLTFAATDFTEYYSDAEGTALSAVRIDTLPDGAQGKLQLSGVDMTAAQVVIAAGLTNITFVPAADYSGDASFTWVASDGVDYAASAATMTLSIASVNDAPTLTATGTNPTFTENGAAVTLFGAAACSTVESGQMITGLTLTVTNVADGSSETLTVDGDSIGLTDGNSGTTAANGVACSVSVAGSTATVTLTKAAGLSTTAVQGLVNAITYANASEAPTGSTRVVTLTSLTDDGGGAAATAAISIASTVTVTAVEDAPGIAGTVGGQTVNDTGTISPFTNVTITDVDSASLTVTVTVMDTFLNPVADRGTLSDGTHAYPDVYTVTGTPAAVTAAVRALVFAPAANRVAPGSTETTKFNIAASDGHWSSCSAGTTVDSTSVNDAPTDITLSASLIYVGATGTDVTVGTLSTTDIDIGETFTYELVAGTGDTHNGLFYLSADSLIMRSALDVGTYTVRVKASDGEATVEKALSVTVAYKAAKDLTPDITDNSVDNNIVITFTAGADADFAAAITGVSFNGHTLDAAQYTVENSKITLHPSSAANNHLRTPATANVVVTAAGYTDSTISQTITAGAVASLVVSTQPVPGLETGNTFSVQPVVSLLDQYGNPCTADPSASFNVVASAADGTGTWSIGGTTTAAASNGVASFTDLICTLGTSGTGKITFICNTTITVDSSAFTIPERNSSIAPTSLNFDKYTAAAGHTDIAVTLTLNSNTLGSIKNGAAALVSGTDYTVSGSDCTIKKEYLTTLYTGSVQLTFDFDIGVDPVLTITVSDSTPSYDSPAPTLPKNDAVVEVNGERQDAGETVTQTSNGQTTTTITVDDDKLDAILKAEGEGATVTLPVSTASNVVVGQLSGQTVKNMEAKEATLEIRTETATYTLPASQINIDKVSSQIGAQVELKDIKVSVSIAEPPADTVRIVEDTASRNNYQIVVKPVEFSITCTSGDHTVEVSRFNGYVERTVAIPDGIDPTKITTGIVINEDGTFSHVPTAIIQINGKYYAKINSLTNSTYSVIWNPTEFSDAAGHWAQDAINDMGSRLIVTGVGENSCAPNREITRAEFAAIVVRALGLRPGTGGCTFSDVADSAWYCGYVQTASEYGILTGYGNGSFGPGDLITREQAMTMLARAMKLTGLDPALSDAEIDALLAGYTDGGWASDFARAGISACLDAGVATGTGNAEILPKTNITRAEVAVMVERLLKISGLI